MLSFQGKKIIAGPCSAESRKQVLDTAKQLSEIGITNFRAGVWKPRTKPGDFEGVGELAFDWLKEVKDTFGLNILIEVANSRHVEIALKNNVNNFWIGARTTVNPFSVQEIADSLNGVEANVLVKNPVNPDLKLWIGGIERIISSGVKEVGAIHRGFSVYEKVKYRNDPKWQIALDLKSELPEIELLCDPSHIAGRASLIEEVSQKAFNLNYDGLMIETHYSPVDAWTDAKQQISPYALQGILNDIIVPDNESLDLVEIENIRDQIDEIDEEILKLISQRLIKAEEIGKLKFIQNLSVFQKKRWYEILNRVTIQASQLNVKESFIRELYKVMHQESISVQQKFFSEKE